MGDAFPARVEQLTFGAVPATAAQTISEKYKSCLDNFGPVTIRQSAVLAAAIAIAVWFLDRFLHFAESFADATGMFGAIVYVAVPAVLMGCFTKLLAEHKLTLQTGHPGVVKLGLIGWLVPIGTALLFALPVHSHLFF